MSSTVPAVKIDKTAPGYEQMHKQAKDLEGVFLNTLMKEVFSSIKTDDKNFGGGFAEDTWRGMQAEQLAGSMADAGGVGLADSLMGDLMHIQEAAQSKGLTP